jgi:hypothetical protein
MHVHDFGCFPVAYGPGFLNRPLNHPHGVVTQVSLQKRGVIGITLPAAWVNPPASGQSKSKSFNNLPRSALSVGPTPPGGSPSTVNLNPDGSIASTGLPLT